MPSELRHVLFSPAEVLEAVVSHRRRSRLPLPTGPVGEAVCEVAKSGVVQFRVEVRTDHARGGEPAVSVVFGEEELLAALLGYCRERSIPVPMRAAKSLERFGPRLGLVMTLNAEKGEVSRPG